MDNRSVFGAPKSSPAAGHGGAIPSLSELPVNRMHADYFVTGSGTINQLTALPAGQVVTLEIGGAPTFVNSAKLICRTGGNITAAAGDLIVARSEGNGVWRIYPLTAGNVVAANNGSEFTNPATFRSNLRIPILGYIYGLTSSSTSFPFTSFDVAAGSAADSTGVDIMTLGSSLSKHGDTAWSVGVSGGTLDSGSTLTTGWWHIFIIKRPDTGVVDIAISTSDVSPTIGGNIPSAYTLSRYIGSFLVTAGPVITSYTQINDTFSFVAGVQNAVLSTLVNARQAIVAKAPPNSKALLRIYASHPSANGVDYLFQPMAETDRTPGTYPSLYAETLGQGAAGEFMIQLDGSSQFAARASAATASNIYVETKGWIKTK